MTLGEKIARQRKEQNLTQEQLAEILGVSRQSVSKWEQDIAYPETEKLIELGKVFDCSMDYLLKENITEKGGVPSSYLSEKVEKLSRTISADKSRAKEKKLLVGAGIALATVLAVDLVSMIIYFVFFGLPG